MDSDFKEEHKRKKYICMAILLNFEDKIKYDYTMPSFGEIRERIVSRIHRVKLSGKVRKMIDSVIEVIYGGDSFFDEADSDLDIYRTEWFCGFGDIVAWRQGREEVQKMVSEYFSEEDLNQFKKLKKIFIVCKEPFSSNWFDDSEFKDEPHYN